MNGWLYSNTYDSNINRIKEIKNIDIIFFNIRIQNHYNLNKG